MKISSKACWKSRSFPCNWLGAENKVVYFKGGDGVFMGVAFVVKES